MPAKVNAKNEWLEITSEDVTIDIFSNVNFIASFNKMRTGGQQWSDDGRR